MGAHPASERMMVDEELGIVAASREPSGLRVGVDVE
jgi:hypothetical protein